nr:MAG: RNA dependent RNA polymerase [Leviviridae sp.]
MDFQELTYSIARSYVLDHSRDVPTAVSNRVLGWIRSRDLQALSSCSNLLEAHESSFQCHRFLLQVEAFFKKNDVFTVEEEATAKAVDSFFKAEAICRDTNNRLDSFYSEETSEDMEELTTLIGRAQQWIADTLGDELPPREILEGVRLTAGATATRPRSKAQPHRKVRKRVTSTFGAYRYLSAISEAYGYGKLNHTWINWNRVQFVPKTWKTHRTIACEPDENIPVQLAIDSAIKKRLLRRDLNLGDQSRNQLFAMRGSLRDDVATIDLEMASDTLAMNAVVLLLPQKWVEMLASLRAPFGRLPDGQKLKYEKFSSMGNGYTFTLETLIFASLCHAVGASSHEFVVYGDDIAIMSRYAERLIALLKYLGFVPNMQKTHLAGPYRESCGQHWHDGRLITPFYLRTVSDRKPVLSHIVNGLAWVSISGGEVEALLLRLIREFKLPLVPWNEDSMSGVWVSPNAAYSARVFKTRNSILSYRRLVTQPAKEEHCFDMRGEFLWFLRAVNPSFSEDPWAPLNRCLQVSRTTLRSRYRERRGTYNVPLVACPDHLYLWSGPFVSGV